MHTINWNETSNVTDFSEGNRTDMKINRNLTKNQLHLQTSNSYIPDPWLQDKNRTRVTKVLRTDFAHAHSACICQTAESTKMKSHPPFKGSRSQEPVRAVNYKWFTMWKVWHMESRSLSYHFAAFYLFW